MNNIDKFFDKNVELFSKKYLDYVKDILDNIDLSEIKGVVSTILKARKEGATVFFIGNGGSAATASHFANDLAYGVNDYKQPFRIMSLTDNNAVLTALANDYGYEDVFSRQLQIHGRSGDVVVAISASGNSENIIKAFEYAKKAGITSVALTAFDGGKMKCLADQGIHVPTGQKEYGPAEDAHMILDHLIGSYLMRLVDAERD